MPVTLTIKQVPEPIAEKLRLRASASHRSLQGELMAILEAAALQSFPQVKQQDPAPYVTKRIVHTAKGAVRGSRLTIAELWERSRRLGPKSRNESSTIVRALRDGRYSR